MCKFNYARFLVKLLNNSSINLLFLYIPYSWLCYGTTYQINKENFYTLGVSGLK